MQSVIKSLMDFISANFQLFTIRSINQELLPVNLQDFSSLLDALKSLGTDVCYKEEDIHQLAGKALSSATRAHFFVKEKKCVGIYVKVFSETDSILICVSIWHAESSCRSTIYSLTPDGFEGQYWYQSLERVLTSILTRSHKAELPTAASFDELPDSRSFRISVHTHSYSDALHDLIDSGHSYFMIDLHGEICTDIERGRIKILFCGSFNPLHEGHVGLFQVSLSHISEKHPHIEAAFELSVVNADKGRIVEQVLHRAAQFAGRYNLIITQAATFIEKARIFPNTIFVVGFDTIVRVLKMEYYGGTEKGLVGFLREFEELNCSFLVGGRVVDDRRSFMTMSQVVFTEKTKKYAHLFQPIDTFRLDISSTELRKIHSLS
ncbi:uncharacterized protein LOC126316746 isoform X3 [Schistocerca gregaria]|uniref:uncharacterized protein LOC126316746 isoform X3 n=1 Tax=Schistocerca gregaria TaxID=7010 RepID=UPI00211E0566|nr:uncharacterized protein LOC126316746 isoform X3 [Schistocerca gregaria]